MKDACHWKKVNVCPIFRKGCRRKPNNYRPVSLTLTACKVMEKLMRDGMLNHMNVNNLFSVEQHGFMEGRSCLTNLLETLEFWIQALDEGYGIDTIYLDYSKAFNSVPFERLLKKVEGMGYRGEWIREFLTDRKMRVRGEFMEWNRVMSGVLQGSVLGPILFVLYVNDIPEGIRSLIKLFADDPKVLGKVRNEEDRDMVQRDMDYIEEWSGILQFGFNLEKSKCMHSGKQANPWKNTMWNGRENLVLKEVHEEKDLGVWCMSNLKCSKQCNEAAKKATLVLRNLKKSFEELEAQSFQIIYKTYITTHLQYAVQAWCPKL